MRLRWTDEAQEDLRRVHDFLAEKNLGAAARAVDSLLIAPLRLLEHPYAGSKVESMQEQGVRRILVGSYEIRYDIVDDFVRILRLFHMREER